MDPTTLAIAYSLSGVAGLRAALTLFLVSLATHMGSFHPAPGMAWIGEDQVLFLSGCGVFVEFFADKVPAVDHGLHALQLALVPIIGGMVAAAADPSGGTLFLLFATGGAVNAFGIHAARSALRVGSSALSFGALNPLVSVAEDVLALLCLLAILLVPVLTAAVLLLATILLLRRLVGRRPAPTVEVLPPAPGS